MTFEEAMELQAQFCIKSGAPITATVCAAIARALDASSATGRRATSWTGDMLADALPLRLMAPFHALYRSRRAVALDALFEGRERDDVAAIRATVAAYDAEIVGWLDGPPQTNEPGRSATFMAALSVLARRFGHPFEILEIGSSAGLNLLIDRYAYQLGDARFGPVDAPVSIVPEWRGRSLEQAEVEFASIRGVDIAPLDVRLPDVAQRLLAYVWVDTPERSRRVEHAIAMVCERAVDLISGDAADWIETNLVQPQEAPTTRVVMHSVVWRYLPPDTQMRIEQAMAAAGALATADRPLAWIAFEQDDFSSPHRLRLRVWPGGNDTTLATAHPHGSSIDWLG